MIHIPLGSGVILPVDQLHAGHYGKENNIRYHAILADEGWDGSQLLLLEDYNKKQLRMTTNYQKRVYGLQNSILIWKNEVKIISLLNFHRNMSVDNA